MLEKGSHKYDDIIKMEHPTSENHPRMSMHDRAAQFSPFAALTGHSDAIKETTRLTESRMELDENRIEELNNVLLQIEEKLDIIEGSEAVEVTYFVPDKKKDGGAYITVCGNVAKIDRYKRLLIMSDGRIIPTNDIIEIRR